MEKRLLSCKKKLSWKGHLQMYSRKCTQNSGSLKPEGPEDTKASCGTEDKTKEAGECPTWPKEQKGAFYLCDQALSSVPSTKGYQLHSHRPELLSNLVGAYRKPSNPLHTALPSLSSEHRVSRGHPFLLP